MGSDKLKDFRTPCILFAICMICFILTIVLPIVIVTNPGYSAVCYSETNLNRGEQIWCRIDDKYLDSTWVVDLTHENDREYGKVYRSLAFPHTFEYTMKWTNFEVNVAPESYVSYPISCPVYIRERLVNITCHGTSCKKAQGHYLTREQYTNARKDSLDDMENYGYHMDLEDGSEVEWSVHEPSSSKFYYLVFSNIGNKEVSISFSAEFEYCGANTSVLTPSELKDGKLKIDDLDEDEYIIVDYPNENGINDASDHSSPRALEVSIHDIDINWGGVAACIIIFGLITVASFMCGVYSMRRKMKKLGKIKKRSEKKEEEAKPDTYNPDYPVVGQQPQQTYVPPDHPVHAAQPQPQPQPDYVPDYPVVPAQPQAQPQTQNDDHVPDYPVVSAEPQPQPQPQNDDYVPDYPVVPSGN